MIVSAVVAHVPSHRKSSAKSDTKERIYLSPPHMSDEGYEKAFVQEAFETNWIAPIGPHVNALEQEFAHQNGSLHAAALSTGTAAQHLALRLLGIKPGDEVICSSLTFCASANPIVYEGATPVFIDAEARSWNMDPELLTGEIERLARANRLPKAVIVVDLYGQSADWLPILEICQRYDVPVLEDAAEALGATYGGIRTGNFGYAGVFSFNGNKIITGSGGGMLVSPDEKLIAKARSLSTQARVPAPHYQHVEIGYNYRMSNVVAAIIRGQLKVLPERILRKRAIFDWYRARLADIPGVSFMPEAPFGQSNRWLTCILVDPSEFGATAEDIRQALENQNIESRPLWKPLHMQPVFTGCRMVGGAVSERLFATGLCLPSGTALTEDQLEEVVRVIESVHRAAHH
jgi:pyridoxal phosphate-dependent aminotransferase EpsN